MATKHCRGCGEEKTLDEFHRDARTEDGRSARCASCRSRAAREWYRKDPEKRQAVDRAYYERERERILKRVEQRTQTQSQDEERRERQRAWKRSYMREYRKNNYAVQKDRELRQQYGITLADYNAILESQGGCCAICGEDSRLHLDHNHKTDEIRGILCQACNHGLGRFKDDPALLRKAADYLERTG